MEKALSLCVEHLKEKFPTEEDNEFAKLHIEKPHKMVHPRIVKAGRPVDQNRISSMEPCAAEYAEDGSK